MKRYLLIKLLLLVCSLPAFAKTLSGPAPDFTLPSNTGSNIRLSELKGEVVLLNFWASWCGPCRQEMPELEKLHKKYKRLGFTVLGVNAEKKHKKADKIVEKGQLTFPILYDTESSVYELYKVKAMPSTILIDRDGNQRFLHLGYKPGYEKDYERQIKRLVRE